MIKKLLLFFAAFSLFAFSASAQTPNASGVLFVNKNVVGGAQSGDSWANALPEAATAFKAAKQLNDVTPGTVTQIWVAAGTYKPMFNAADLNSTNLDDRLNTFLMVNNVKIYGGFKGDETLFSQRNLSLGYKSILSGAIGVQNDMADNAYNVVSSFGNVGTAEINGFTIIEANSVLQNIVVNGINYNNYGAGMCVYESSPLITNMEVRGNMSNVHGGGIGLLFSNSVLTNVLITGNLAPVASGLCVAFTGNVVITNCTLSGNNAGAIYVQGTNLNIRNSVVAGNNIGMQYTFSGEVVSIKNSLIQDNAADAINFNLDGSINPQFVNAPSYTTAPFTGGIYSLNATSPLINAGANTYYSVGQTPDLSSVTIDLKGDERIVNTAIDIGVYEYVLPIITSTKTDVLCYSETTGLITPTVSGGTPPYTYSWNTTPVQTTKDITGLSAGTYTLTVTDAATKTATHTVTITQPSALTATAATQVDVLCNGNATGTATVNVTGGTGAYSYSWDTTPVQTTATATGLAAGTYTVTVTDANLCTTTQAFTITQPSALTATAGTQIDVLCHGNATGEATVNVIGGTGTYSYSWDTTLVQTTATATGLTAGTYTVTVTDANSCTATQSFTITEPSTAMTLTPNTTQTDILCNGQATGSATIAVTGGTGAYTYLWSNGGTTNTITGLIAGTYTVDVTDTNGCILSNSFTITQPSALTATAGTQVDVLCHGNATGEATVNVTGGTGAYTYSWDTTPVQTTATATGLAAGTYTVTVTDANLCTTTQALTITEPSLLVATAGPQNNVLCYGNATGTAFVNVTGGTGAYTYSWDTTPVQTTATATGLAAGTYTVTVTDANLCTTTQAFTITEPSAVTATAGTQVDVLCQGAATGEATVNVTGGTGTYTYSWDTTPVQATATATGLTAGTHTVTVTDANLCTTTQAFTITEPLQPLALTPNTTQTDILCNGQATGSATIAVTGGTGAYTYLWSNGQTTNTITGLTAGTYTVDVTDANGCILSHSYTITQPSALVATAGSQTNVLCFGNATGEATVNVTGGTGAYVYNWSPSGGTAATATGLAAGTYNVTVTDANLCQTTQSFTITQPLQPLSTTPNTSHTNVSCFGGANGTATIAVTGGTAPYSYLWSNGQTAAIATGLSAGTYTVDATDANGCTISGSFTITEPTALVASADAQSNVSCFGAANGSATVTATGGTGTYTYSWNTTPVQTNATATGLAPGNYTVTVTDDNLCTATQLFTITEPQQLTAVVDNYTDVLCFGAATGSATVNVVGGTLPYSYLWSNGQTMVTANGLTAGTYSVVVTDANGCQINAGITITQPATPLVATAGAQTNLLCYGNTNGSATVNATGGTGTYTYSWAPSGGTAATASGLAAGIYTVTVTDANGCTTTQSFTITQPAAVSGYFTVVNSDCHETGSATVHAVGGIAPYTYLWSNGTVTPNLLNALPGTYTVTITDANGCSNILSTTIYGSAPIVVISAPQSVVLDGGETVVFTVEAQNVTTYQWQVSTNGGLSYTNLNLGGSLPTYYGVSTPTLTVANAYQSIDGYLYRVILLQQSGCYVLSEAATLNVNPVVVGTDDIKQLVMDIYPNPASTDLFVKIPDFDLYGNVKVAMYDLNGRIVKREELITSENYRIDVTGLESAIYVISITSDAGRTDKKVVIKK